MRLVLAKEVLNRQEAWRHLDRIIDLVEANKHELEIGDIDDFTSSGWLSFVGHYQTSNNKQLIEKLFVATSYVAPTHHRLIRICSAPTNEYEQTPGAAVTYLGKPVAIVVENSATDGAFVICMAKIHLHRLADALVNGLAVFVHAGGSGELVKRAKEENLARVGPGRVFVFADSDRLFPNEVSTTVRTVTEKCETASIPFALLRKRETENYLPIEALQGRDGSMATAFLRLAPEQQDHFDMKKGFRRGDDGEAIVPESQADLYATVQRPILRNLCGGFGNEVGSYFSNPGPAFDLVAFRHICRTAPNEISGILEEIWRLV